MEGTEPETLNEMFPGGPSLHKLINIARRHDSDIYACLKLDPNGEYRIVVAKTWTSSGYTILAEHDSFRGFYAEVFADAREWADMLQDR